MNIENHVNKLFNQTHCGCGWIGEKGREEKKSIVIKWIISSVGESTLIVQVVPLFVGQ